MCWRSSFETFAYQWQQRHLKADKGYYIISKKQDSSFTVWVVTTEAGTCRTVAVAVPRVRGDPEAPGATVIPLAPATTLAAMETTLAHVDAMRGLLPVVVVIVMVWPCFCGMTPRPGIIRMVVPLLSGEETVEKVLDFWSPTARVGISRMALSPAAFSRVEAAGAALLVCTSAAQGKAPGAEDGDAWGGVTWRVADMLLLPAVALLRNSGVSLTVATGDLARVAIMSGVMRNTVCPFASVVMDEGGRRRTSFPWIRRFVAVIGIPVPPVLFIPNWPVMDTFNKINDE